MQEIKPKILIVHNYYQIPGGEDTVVANEKKMLEEHGHPVVLYTRHNRELKTLSVFQKILLPFATIFNMRTYREIKKIIKEQKIDIVHVHNTLNLISPSVYYAANSCKVPVVQTIHNFRMLCPNGVFYRDGHICEDCAEKGLHCAVKHCCYRNSKLQTLALVLTLKLHRATGIYKKLNYICLTEFNKEKLLQLKQIKAEHVFVKPNFVPAYSKEVVPCEKRENQFVFVGRLEKIKGVDILLQAWLQLQQELGQNTPGLVLCGTGPMENWCRQYIKEHNLDMVSMLGFVPNEKAKELIAKSKALVLPTQVYEGFPMTIAEAYSVGTPVIGSQLGNTGALIQAGAGSCFPHDDVEALVKILKNWSLKDQPDAQKYYMAQLSPDANYLQLYDVYQNVM